jgi:hypothetical protein
LVLLRQQYGEEIVELLAWFKRTTYEAGAESWPDGYKILLLINTLAAPARARLNRKEWPDNLEAFYTLLRRFDGIFSDSARED